MQLIRPTKKDKGGVKGDGDKSMKVLVWTGADGKEKRAGLGPQQQGETEQQWVERIAATTVPVGTSWTAVESGTLASLGRKPRRLFDIYTQILALPAADKDLIWADLDSGTPRKWTQHQGPSAAAMMALHWSAANSGASVANVNNARVRLASLYCLDVPGYLVNPPFAPHLNVPGDEPA